MSDVSLRHAIEQQERRLAEMRAVATKYDDASYFVGRYSARSAAPDVERIAVCEPPERGFETKLQAQAFVTHGDRPIPVVAGEVELSWALHRLRTTKPAAYADLLAIVAAGDDDDSIPF